MIRAAFLAVLLSAAPALAQDYNVGDIAVTHPHAFATPANAPVGGGYMAVTNAGVQDDVLVSVSVAAEVAGMVQLHSMTMEAGVMRMSQVDGGIPVPAGQTVMLESGGLHVMFMDLASGLPEGTRFPAMLTFRDAGAVEVEFVVEARGAAGIHDH